MVPGEENQLVPKEVRGQRRRLGPRPAAALGSAGRGEGPAAGPARGPARLWGKEVLGVRGGCGEQLGDPTGSRGPGSGDLSPWVSGAGQIKERTGRNRVLLWGRRWLLK